MAIHGSQMAPSAAAKTHQLVDMVRKVRGEGVVAAWVDAELSGHRLGHVAQQAADEHVEVDDRTEVVGEA